MLEKVFENKIKKLLKEKQAYYVKFFGCGITTAGTPDILACVNGHFIGIECKADNDNSEQWRYWYCGGSMLMV